MHKYVVRRTQGTTKWGQTIINTKKEKKYGRTKIIDNVSDVTTYFTFGNFIVAFCVFILFNKLSQEFTFPSEERRSWKYVGQLGPGVAKMSNSDHRRS